MPDTETDEHRLLSELVVPVQEKITSGRDASLPYVGLEQIPSRGSYLTNWLLSGASISTNSVFRAGDTLFGKLRPNLRKCVTAPFDGYCSTDILVLRARPSVDARFASRVFQSEFVGRAAEQTAIGTKMPRTSWEALATLVVFIPGLREQKLIADILDGIDEAIRQAEIAVEKLKQVKQGLLHDLLTRGVDSNGRLRPLPTARCGSYAATALGLLPTEWRPGRIVEYLDESDGLKPGPFGSSIKKETYAETGFKVYGQEQVISGDQSAGDYFVPLRKFQELSDFAVQEGDVLISLVGTVGKVLVLRAPLQPGLINPRLMRLRCSFDKAIPEFIGLLIGSNLYARQISRFAGGGTMPVINKSILSEIMTPIIGIDEQRRIVSVWESLGKRLENEVSTYAKLREQKAGLVDDLLTGHVRVTSLLEK